MRCAFLLILLASSASAQSIAEPQLQLTRQHNSKEAPPNQHMFYNLARSEKRKASAGHNSDILSLTALTKIVWPDGQVSTGPVTAGGGGGFISTSAYVYNWTATSTAYTFTLCYATATITTTVSGHLHVAYTGPLSTSSGVRYVAIGFLLNGGYVGTMNSNTPLISVGDGGIVFNGSYDYPISGIYSAGTYHACFTMVSNSASATASACASAIVTGETWAAPNCSFGIYSTP